MAGATYQSLLLCRARHDAWGLSARSTRAEVERGLSGAGIAFAPALYPWEEQRTGELVTWRLGSLVFMAPEGPAADGALHPRRHLRGLR